MDTSAQSEWQFLQCFGERTPGEDIQEGRFKFKGASVIKHATLYNKTHQRRMIMSLMFYSIWGPFTMSQSGSDFMRHTDRDQIIMFMHHE